MLIQNNKQLSSFIGSIHASYVWLYNCLDVFVTTHQVPSIVSLTKAKPKNQDWKKVEEYLEQPRQNSTREDLELNAQQMHNFIGGWVKVKKMFLMLYNELDTSSKTVYPYSMEARVCFQQDTIKKFGDTITQYQAWHQYVTKKQQVEVVELDLSQTPTSQCCVLLGCLYPILSYMGTIGKFNIICNYVVSEIPSANIGI